MAGLASSALTSTDGSRIQWFRTFKSIYNDYIAPNSGPPAGSQATDVYGDLAVYVCVSGFPGISRDPALPGSAPVAPAGPAAARRGSGRAQAEGAGGMCAGGGGAACQHLGRAIPAPHPHPPCSHADRQHRDTLLQQRPHGPRLQPLLQPRHLGADGEPAPAPPPCSSAHWCHRPLAAHAAAQLAPAAGQATARGWQARVKRPPALPTLPACSSGSTILALTRGRPGTKASAGGTAWVARPLRPPLAVSHVAPPTAALTFIPPLSPAFCPPATCPGQNPGSTQFVPLTMAWAPCTPNVGGWGRTGRPKTPPRAPHGAVPACAPPSPRARPTTPPPTHHPDARTRKRRRS
jgi:hypothetical protein